MKVVNSLIFNSLASRKSINMPSIGSLRIELSSARMKGKNRLALPVIRVVYSKNETEGAQSVVELIEYESGADRKKAEELYRKWLAEVKLERVITIDGVGRVNNDFFTPSPELASLLNPDTRDSIKLKRRTSGRLITVVLLIILIITAGYGVVKEGIANDWFNWGDRTLPQTEVVVLPQPIISVADTVKQDSVTVDSSAVTEAEVVIAPISSGSIYHIIAGVYSTAANADKFIAQARVKADTLPYKVIPLSNGKFLISIFESNIEEAANKRRSELIKADPNLWIHKTTN